MSETKDLGLRIRQTLGVLRDALEDEAIGPQHLVKRDLERWFREKGFSRSRARAATAAAFQALRRPAE